MNGRLTLKRKLELPGLNPRPLSVELTPLTIRPPQQLYKSPAERLWWNVKLTKIGQTIRAVLLKRSKRLVDRRYIFQIIRSFKVQSSECFRLNVLMRAEKLLDYGFKNCFLKAKPNLSRCLELRSQLSTPFQGGLQKPFFSMTMLLSIAIVDQFNLKGALTNYWFDEHNSYRKFWHRFEPVKLLSEKNCWTFICWKAVLIWSRWAHGFISLHFWAASDLVAASEMTDTQPRLSRGSNPGGQTEIKQSLI